MDKRLHYLGGSFPDAQHNILSMQCNSAFYSNPVHHYTTPSGNIYQENTKSNMNLNASDSGHVKKEPSHACIHIHSQQMTENIERLNFDKLKNQVLQWKVKEMRTTVTKTLSVHTVQRIYAV